MLHGTLKKRLLLTLFLSLFVIAGCNNGATVFQGYIEGKYSYLASAVSGNLISLSVYRGDRVKANQELFVLDPEPESSKLKQAIEQNKADMLQLANLKTGQRATILESIVAQRAQAIANMNLAEKNYKRYQQLLVKRAIDKATFDAAKANYDAAVQRVEEVKANLEEAKQGARENLIAAQEAVVEASTALVKQAEWAMAQKVVRAKMDGEIFDTLFLVGEFVAAGQPVISFLAPKDITLIFFVPPKVLSRIKKGDKITFESDGGSKRYEAHITFISPEVEYTPPVIFSKDTRDKLVFRIEATPLPNEAAQFHPGQPIDIYLK